MRRCIVSSYHALSFPRAELARQLLTRCIGGECVETVLRHRFEYKQIQRLTLPLVCIILAGRKLLDAIIDMTRRVPS